MLVIVMKSGVFKNIIESSGRQKPILLTIICGQNHSIQSLWLDQQWICFWQ
jgi:hypothetical protein